MAKKKNPGKLEIPLGNIFSDASSREYYRSGIDLAGSTTHSSTVSTITSEKIQEMVEALQRESAPVDLPDVDKEDANWSMAMVMALLNVFRVHLTVGSPSPTLSSMLKLQMTFPFGEHQYTQTVANNAEMDLGVRSPGTYNQNILHARYTMLKHMLLRQLESQKIWMDIAKNGTKYTVKQILALKNIEHRMAALRIFGADRLIQEAGALLVNKSARGNELYLIPRDKGLFDEDAYFLKYQCVSTGRIYVSGVPAVLFDRRAAARNIAVARSSDSADAMAWSMFGRRTPRTLDVEAKYMHDYPREEWADLGMAWKFRLTLQEYKTLSRANEG